jgi:hypothetical protein
MYSLIDMTKSELYFDLRINSYEQGSEDSLVVRNNDFLFSSSIINGCWDIVREILFGQNDAGAGFLGYRGNRSVFHAFSRNTNPVWPGNKRRKIMSQTKLESWIYFFLGLTCFLIPSLVAVFIVYDRGISFAPVFMFAGIVIWFGLFWLFPFIEKKFRKGQTKVSFDERDQLIHKRAVMVAYVVLWLYFVAECVIAWCIVGPHGSIPVNVMPLTLIGGLVIFTTVQGLVSLIQYNRGGKDGGE